MTNKMYGYELQPFTELIWKHKGKTELQPVMDEITNSASVAEMKTVADGIRDVATWTVRSTQIDRTMNQVAGHNLVFVPIRKSQLVQGFAHKFYPPKEGEPVQIFGAVAKDYDTALKFKKARKEGGEENSDIMGELLGYPECCREYFSRTYQEEFDPVWTSALNTEGAEVERGENEVKVYLDDVYPSVNPLLRYVGLNVAPHLPCSYKCEESKKLAKAFLKYIKHSDLLLSILSGPIEWDCYRGIAIIKTPYFRIVIDSMPYKKHHKIIIGDKNEN